MLEAVAALVTAERPEWRGTATELVAALGLDMKPNALAMRLNVRAWRLSYEYHIHYESARTHAGRSIKLTLEEPHGKHLPGGGKAPGLSTLPNGE